MVVQDPGKGIFIVDDAVESLRQNPERWELCLEIQEVLIQKISYIEGRVRRTRLEGESYRTQLRKKAFPPMSKESAQILKKKLTRSKEKTSEYQYLIYVFKLIGDGIAHIYINKWDIKPMSVKESAGFISGKKGSRLERKAFRKCITLTKRPLILNDITNCLRY